MPIWHQAYVLRIAYTDENIMMFIEEHLIRRQRVACEPLRPQATLFAPPSPQRGRHQESYNNIVG